MCTALWLQGTHFCTQREMQRERPATTSARTHTGMPQVASAARALSLSHCTAHVHTAVCTRQYMLSQQHTRTLRGVHLVSDYY